IDGIPEISLSLGCVSHSDVIGSDVKQTARFSSSISDLSKQIQRLHVTFIGCGIILHKVEEQAQIVQATREALPVSCIAKGFERLGKVPAALVQVSLLATSVS